MATTIKRRLLSVREVGLMLGYSKKSVHALVDKGVLKPVQLGSRGHLRFRVEDVEALIQGERPHE